jgi:hypothetical protein
MNLFSPDVNQIFTNIIRQGVQFVVAVELGLQVSILVWRNRIGGGVSVENLSGLRRELHSN